MTSVGIGIMIRGFAIALVAAIVAAITCSWCYAAFRILGSSAPISSDTFAGFIFVAIFAAYYAAPAAFAAIVVAAFPGVLLSMRLRLTSLKHYLMSGALIGLGTILVVIGWPLELGEDLYFLILSGTITGVAAALAFWLVVRPDNLRHGPPVEGS